MIVYVDSSVLARGYLPDEAGHGDAVSLIYQSAHPLVTAAWTVVEVTSALSRAHRGHRVGNLDAVLTLLGMDTDEDGVIALLRADPVATEVRTTQIARDHAIRSLDALHLAVAELAARPLAGPGEPVAFVSGDKAQRTAARALGFAQL